jgi:hypothetical protein
MSTVTRYKHTQGEKTTLKLQTLENMCPSHENMRVEKATASSPHLRNLLQMYPYSCYKKAGDLNPGPWMCLGSVLLLSYISSPREKNCSRGPKEERE